MNYKLVPLKYVSEVARNYFITDKLTTFT